ncbi:hypothetical protein TTHERM_00976480 (macronuclear) [Tetrahymena thermophila SB210]|uniref:Uncharacterized protein n=1 Tax=Tetrahymena thermophila (strain SB210) TaxID=312017 RepID=Q24GR3_TETTS|nr:hypothetical protein TTHERM_00976480 [Tetrahymena thermophila SB210]EAS06944.1 hypothetical protein TTHERM_00976480 [Tetrahymena thermophila SB210]|eukprot:XP_001027186.1 hypothetical protein TTHERM_00976480 [Tetrahymena thermophila SB210]
MISNLNYFSSDMSLSNPDIQNQMITDQDDFEYENNKENFFNNQYSNIQQYSSTNSSLRSSPINLRRSSSNRNTNNNNTTERIPLQDLTESEETYQTSMSNAQAFLAQQENQFFQYRQQQKNSFNNQPQGNNINQQKVTRANLLR